MNAIEAYNLTKRNNIIAGVSDVSLQVPEGCAFALVGREGCGKTALMRLLSGLDRPDMGECSVMGYSSVFESEKLHSVTGVVLETADMYKELTVSKNLQFFAELNGIDENDAIDRSSFLLHGLNIWEYREEKVDDLPTGVLRRASLARALMHRPRVLLLDEPSNGMDQETADSVGELLARLVSSEGLTVFLSTRDMDYAEQLCEGFALLKDGMLMAKGTIEELRKSAGLQYRALLRLKEGETPPKGFYPWADGQWRKEIASEEELPKIISQLVSEGKSLYEARLDKPGLQEIYAAFSSGGVQRAGEQYGDENESETEFETAESDGTDGQEQTAAGTGQTTAEADDGAPQEEAAGAD